MWKINTHLPPNQKVLYMALENIKTKNHHVSLFWRVIYVLLFSFQKLTCVPSIMVVAQNMQHVQKSYLEKGAAHVIKTILEMELCVWVRGFKTSILENMQKAWRAFMAVFWTSLYSGILSLLSLQTSSLCWIMWLDFKI